VSIGINYPVDKAFESGMFFKETPIMDTLIRASGPIKEGEPVFLVGLEELECLKADAEKWRNRYTHPTLDEWETDAYLGYLVRKMPVLASLSHVKGKWKVYGNPDSGWFDTPEEALRNALGEPK